MAVFTETRRCDVVKILSGRCDTVMATRATRIDTEMIEKHREPAGRAMAAVALLLSRRMIRRLSNTLHIVVATRTTTEDRIVIHFYERKPLAATMAVLAEIRTQHVIGGLRCGGADAPPD